MCFLYLWVVFFFGGVSFFVSSFGFLFCFERETIKLYE